MNDIRENSLYDPDYVSGENKTWSFKYSEIGDYMHRLVLTTPFGTVRLHHILRSDDDRAWHDHPWGFVSVLLTGGYTEAVPSDDVGPGGEELIDWPRWSIVRHKAEDLHRLIVKRPIWTLVFTGPYRRKWGFWTEEMGWVYWREYLKGRQQ